MAAESNNKDSRDRTRPDAPDGAAAENEQRRFRGQHQGDQRTPADGKRDKIRGEETATDAPTDPEDDAFLKDK